MNISIIAAITKNYALGKDNEMLYHIPEDLKNFRRITTGHSIVMGKKTYYSLPRAPLPGRKNIVITHADKQHFPGCKVARSVQEAIDLMDKTKENFIIGGADIYEQFINFSDKLYLTWIHEEVKDADTFFPQIDFKHWIETERRELQHHSTKPAVSFVVYKRK
jgi:dihydrofolate reductase